MVNNLNAYFHIDETLSSLFNGSMTYDNGEFDGGLHLTVVSY